MRVVITGAGGLIGRRLVAALLARGDEVVALTRDAVRLTTALGVSAESWQPEAAPAPAAALEDASAVVHLAGEPIAQRWTHEARRRIRDSRVIGTRNLLAGIAALPDGGRPRTLVSASACGYYGPRGEEIVTENDGPGGDFLAGICVAWEREAQAAETLGLRTCRIRTGIVLDPDGGALGRMLGPFRLGLGGPAGSGRQWLPWIHRDDLTGLYLGALDDDSWHGAYNACSPEPVTNAAFAKALGHVLRRPALLPTPAPVLRAMFGEMASTITTGQRAVPQAAITAGFDFTQPEIGAALAGLLEEVVSR